MGRQLISSPNYTLNGLFLIIARKYRCAWALSNSYSYWRDQEESIIFLNFSQFSVLVKAKVNDLFRCSGSSVNVWISAQVLKSSPLVPEYLEMPSTAHYIIFILKELCKQHFADFNWLIMAWNSNILIKKKSFFPAIRYCVINCFWDTVHKHCSLASSGIRMKAILKLKWMSNESNSGAERFSWSWWVITVNT